MSYVRAHREAGEPSDVEPSGSALGDPIRRAGRIMAYAEAGATWWREGRDPTGPITAEEWHRRVLQRPPRPASLRAP